MDSVKLCKNCGHPIAEFEGEVYHIDRGEQKAKLEEVDGNVVTNVVLIEKDLEDETIELHKMCYFSKDDDEILGKTDAYSKTLLKEKYGENYGLDFWFTEIHCLCKKPEL
jgi:hypothetical protein